MDERYLTSFEDQTTALGYTSGDITLVSPQVSLVGADEVVYTKKIPNDSKVRFAKDETTGKLYFIVDVVDSPYVTFTAEEDNSSIGLANLSTNQTMEYSTDTTTWNTFDTTTNISLNNGDKVYIRGVLSADNTDSNYTQFMMTGKIAASGNCNTLWDYNDLNSPLKAYCGRLMFRGCTSLTTAPELPATTLADWCYAYMFSGCKSLTTAPEILPATELANSCYSGMFYDCTALTAAPELPATTLASNCYASMFSGCISLTTAPELPATTLAEKCYYWMFSRCTSLTTVPELPATTLAVGCYQCMFSRSTSLTTDPELPATTLAEYCYSEMFKGCSSLNHITCLATDISAKNCTFGWVAGVSSTGTFVKHTDMKKWPTTGTNGIPEGWTVQDAILAE